MNPLISVVIPTYNSGEFITTAVSSVIDQTYKNVEIIIVDDCSNDNTEQVMKTFTLSKHNIKYIKHGENQGPSAARNTGIAAAKGEFVAFLDADDIWSPKKLEYQYRTLKENPELGVIFTGYILVDLNKRIKREYIPEKFHNHKDFVKNLLLRNIVTPTSSVLVKKECFEEVGFFDTTLKVAEDWDMWIRIAHKYTFGAVESLCVTYIEHSKNVSRNIERMITYPTRVVLKNAQLYEELFSKRDLQLIRRKALSIIYLHGAQSVRDSPKKRREMLRYLAKSMFFYPLKTFERDDKYILVIKAIFPTGLYNVIKKSKNIILKMVYKDGHPRLRPDHEKV